MAVFRIEKVSPTTELKFFKADKFILESDLQLIEKIELTIPKYKLVIGAEEVEENRTEYYSLSQKESFYLYVANCGNFSESFILSYGGST